MMEPGLVGSRPYIEGIQTDRWALAVITWAKTKGKFLMRTILKVGLKDGYEED